MARSQPARTRKILGAATGAAALTVLAAACGGSPSSNASANGSGKSIVTVAVVSQPQIDQLEQLTKSVFEKQNPNITVKFDTLNENSERSQVEQDISTGAGLYDVVMISNYETPLWAKNGWLADLSKFFPQDPSYDPGDILKPIAQSLSYKGDMYSVPIYGESSMLFYRKSILRAAGVSIPEHPTWSQVKAAAAKLNKPGKVAGICLRGQSGWGSNLAPLDTVINTFGGEWFNKSWKPQLSSPATSAAIKFYVNLVRSYGEPGAANDGSLQIFNLYTQGKCALYYDTTDAVPEIAGASQSVLADTGYAYAPTQVKPNSGWLYTWSLGIASKSSHQAAAWKFVDWATSKSYIKLIGQKFGWSELPPGSRTSTYDIPQFQKTGKESNEFILNSISSAMPLQPTVNPVPYTGVQFVDIPQFISLGTQVSQQIAGAIAGTESVQTAIDTSQKDAEASGAGQ